MEEGEILIEQSKPNNDGFHVLEHVDKTSSSHFDLNASPQKSLSTEGISHVSHTNYSEDNEDTSQYSQDKVDFETESSDEDVMLSDPIEEPS
ncbi:hypothetical protein FRX31_033222 [Thalictrum thalictroides]|uniref:Uncharacterized protein n=1 Tax=Thalictrum thalictroides TaxID=46969 RepID=A0A7J6UX59_THATH|nr:hypothetical protein FRX31_033222 [Thalictrum thalictroides]